MGIARCLMMAGSLGLGLTVATPASAAPGDRWPPAGVSYYGDPAVPDISGIWLGTAIGVPGKGAITNSGASSDGRPPTFFAPWPLPYTPAYQKIADERAAALKKGRAVGDIGSRCLPFGLPAMLLVKVYPDEVVQTPGLVTIFIFGTLPIFIWTDGRRHPADLPASFNGHSTGSWTGDTLFVDTVGLNSQTTLGPPQFPHSDKLHLRWTIRRVAADVMHVTVTMDDPEALTEPVVTTNIWHRMTERKWEVLDDGSCFENNTMISDKPVEAGFIKF